MQLDEASDEDKHDPQTHTSPSNDHAVTATGDLLVQTAYEESNPSRKTPQQHSTNPASAFEAASAEAELDMLLNSFPDSTTPDSTGANISGEPTTKVNPTTIDDAIDILLEETSSLAIVGQRTSTVSKADTDSISSINNPVPKSKILDDFDSWLDTI